MDGGWVWVAIGVVGGTFYVLNHTLDLVPGLARRMVNAIDALRTVKAAIKGTKDDDYEGHPS